MKPTEFFTGLLGLALSIAGFVIGAAFVLWVIGLGFRFAAWVCWKIFYP